MDMINPDYYRSHSVQIIDLIRDMPFSLGNAMKYIYRCRSKENKVQDLEKALWYLNDYNANSSKIQYFVNDHAEPEAFTVSKSFIDVLLVDSDNFEKQCIIGVYYNWISHKKMDDIIEIVNHELETIRST